MDILRQVANSISRTAKQTGHNIDRVQENFPLTERVSDFLNAADPFEMEFRTYHKDQRVTLNTKIFDRVIGTPTPCGNCGDPDGGGGEVGCTDSICGITDSFTRTIPPKDGAYGVEYQNFRYAWGISDSGNRWIISGDSNEPPYHTTAGVNGSAGYILGSGLSTASWATTKLEATITVPFTLKFRLRLDDVATTIGNSLDVPITLRANGVPTGAFLFNMINIEGNPVGPGYIGVYETIGTDTVNKDDWQSNTWYNFSFEASSNIMRAKVWADGESEPSWMVEANNADFPNGATFESIEWLWSDFELGATLEFDQLEISGVNKCTKGQFEPFNRVLDGTWGVAPFGKKWINTYSSSDPWIAMDGNYGTFTRPGGTTPRSQVRMDVTPADNAPWSSGTFDLYTRFKVSNASTSSISYALFFTDDPVIGTGPYLRFDINTNGYIVAYGNGHSMVNGYPFGGSSSVTAKSFGTGWYNVRWNIAPGLLHRWKIWSDGSSEPINWDGEILDANGSLLLGDSRFYVDMDAGWPNSASTLSIDYIEFDYPGKPCFFSNIELILLSDTTGSMSTSYVHQFMNQVFPQLENFVSGLRYGLAAYNDREISSDPNDWFVLVPMTEDAQEIYDNIDNLGAAYTGGGGGGDYEENWYRVLYEIGNDLAPTDSRTELGGFLASNALGFRGASKKLIIQLGDAPSHPDDGASVTYDKADALAALIGSETSVIMCDIAGLNEYGGASDIAAQTGGAYVGRGSYSTDQEFYDAIAQIAQNWMTLYIGA